jgi:hypothetical protein
MAYISFQPKDYFNTLLYTGNASTNAVTGVGFQPDWLWVKSRSRTDNHRVIDALRSTNSIQPNQTNAQADVSGDGFTSLDSDGFTLNGSGGGGEFNANSATFASWNWKAGGAGSSNSNGSITSTVSASTTSGFSVVKWTGSGSNATIGHGLGVAPKVVITKSLAASQEWCVGSDVLGWGNYLFLNETSASQSGSVYWQSTAPTSNVFSVGTAGPTNSSSGDLIAYCFTEKSGFSRFGSYTGSGSGNHIYTGFKPAWLMVKKTSGTDAWIIVDNKRDVDNPVSNYLLANSNAQNASGLTYDFLSNGFAFNDSSQNTSSATYFFMAFAEHPLVSSNGVPATAR